MTDMTLEVLKIIMMIAIVAICRFLIPWLKEKMGNERFEAIQKEATVLVLATQQIAPYASGAERLEIVTEKMRQFLIKRNINLTSEQLKDIIEATVKTMKIAQEQGKE